MTIKMLIAAVLLTSPACPVGVPVAQADPLIPLTPAELHFLQQARRIFPGTGDPDAFNSDGELLDQGRSACFQRDVSGDSGYQTTYYISPIITQLAYTYLCP